jgi:adenine-specific DNA-methyltransferase
VTGTSAHISSKLKYSARDHSAARTQHYVFNQLIPYIGNKRKLLGLIEQALPAAARGHGKTFLDVFAGSGVVSRFAKSMGYQVFSNDWEPYARVINGCSIENNKPPTFRKFGGYEAALHSLNSLRPQTDWVTKNLCPRSDTRYDTNRDRMFYMRKNGRRIDAIRNEILNWKESGWINQQEECCLLAPLLYQACYNSNTSGVFKAFHNGWGGRTGTALYRIAGDLSLSPAVFYDNGARNKVFCEDAQTLARQLRRKTLDIAYLDPPYNQHPYGSNYHVLNSIALWDKPVVEASITHGNKSAIRTDWRTDRRSPYNHAKEASKAYSSLLETLNTRFILTSYSTDGSIPLEELLAANVQRGHTSVVMRGYKRYRVSSQRFSHKPMNVEFVLVTDTSRRPRASASALLRSIERQERLVLLNHPESTST